MDNKQLIQKADLALADISSAGKLNPDQTDRFIRQLIDAPTILQNVRTVAMRAPQMKLNKIGLGSRILHSAAADAPVGSALAQGNRSKPTFGSVSLNAQELIAEVRIPYDVLEDNIEGGNPNVALQSSPGGLHNTLVDMIAERVAVDLEELALQGDTGSGDSYLAVTDGFLKRFTTNVVDASSATFTKDTIKSALKAMPAKYLRDRASMKHFVSVNNETELRDQFSNRIGSFGDTNLQQVQALYVHGSEVKGASLMPATSGFFTNPMNCIFGIWRNILMEYDKDITTRTFIIVVTARVDFQVEQEDAAVKYINLAA
jgi:HK97 family phage major capsid protein